MQIFTSKGKVDVATLADHHLCNAILKKRRQHQEHITALSEIAATPILRRLLKTLRSSTIDQDYRTMVNEAGRRSLEI